MLPARSRVCRVLGIGAIVLLAVATAEAQVPLNLGFESPGVRAPNRPWGWYYSGDAERLTRDSAVFRTGAWSLRSGPGSGPERIATLYLPHEGPAGRRIRIQGWVRTEALADGRAGFGVHYARAGGAAVHERGEHQGVTGTTPWTLVTHEALLPSDLAWMGVTAHARGTGIAWFDDLTVVIDGVPFEWALPPAPTERQIEHLREHVIPLNGIDAGRGFADLEALRPLIGDARILALGEANHGSSEFFRAKHRLLEFAVRKLGFTVFAIEDNALAAERVNAYVRTGQGDLDTILRGLFRVWRTREVRDLIEWMRAYNASGAGAPVEFIGYDVQDPSLAIDSVLAFLAQVDPPAQDVARSLYAPMREAWRSERYPARPDSIYERWIRDAERVTEQIARNRASYLRLSDRVGVTWAEQNARLAVQSARLLRDDSFALRDSLMAVNLEWALSVRPPETRAVVWAHNGHIARAEGTMGGFLARGRGEDLRIVGLTAYGGEYNARNPSDGTVAPTPHFPAAPGTMEHALHALGFPYLVVDLRSVATEPMMRWLLDPRPLRSTGSNAVDYDFADLPVGMQFDALLYVERSTAATPL